jgi:hypothetical protein
MPKISQFGLEFESFTRWGCARPGPVYDVGMGAVREVPRLREQELRSPCEWHYRRPIIESQLLT